MFRQMSYSFLLFYRHSALSSARFINLLPVVIGFTAICSALIPVNAQAKEVAGWEISEHGSDCRMTSYFEGETGVSFGWDPFSETRYLLIASEKWDSLGKKESKTADLFIEMNGDVEYKEWWHEDAAILISETGLEGVMAYWERKYENDFFMSFALGTSFSVRIDDVSVGTFSLSGSRAAFLALTACGAELQRKKRDPFSGN